MKAGKATPQSIGKGWAHFGKFPEPWEFWSNWCSNLSCRPPFASENHELGFEDNESICSLLLCSYASCSKNYPRFRGDQALSARGLLQCYARCRWATLCSRFAQYSLSCVQWRTGTVERLSKQRFLFDAHCGHRLKSNTVLSCLSLFLAPRKNWLI